jgi:hypothetical protein
MASAEVSDFIASNPELRYCLEDIKKNGWNFPPAETYPIPKWVFETGQDPLPAFMYAPNGELWNNIDYDPYPGDYSPGENYTTSLQSPDNPAAYSGYGGGGGGYGGYEGGRGGRGGVRGGPARGGRGGGRGICNQFRDRGSCRFGADCNFSHDLEGAEAGIREFSLGERPGGPRPERGGRGGFEGRGGGPPRGGGEMRGGMAPRGGGERGGMRGGGADRGGRGGGAERGGRGGGAERGGRGGGAERGGRGGARGGRGGAAGGAGDLCRFYNTPQGCRFGDSCKSRHA